MAAKVLIVKVTQRHINQGLCGDTRSCAMALACGGRVGFWTGITVKGASYAHSPESKKFVSDFDDGKKVKPATFRLLRFRP